jgi:hypothetical protein
MLRPGRLAFDTSVQAKEPSLHDSAHDVGPAAAPMRPLLLVDIDGVISLFGFPPEGGAAGHGPASRAPQPSQSTAMPEGSFHSIDGIPHFLSTTAARHLLELVSVFDLVWASGWEEKAEEYLPHLLGVPRGLPHLSFAREMHGMGGAAQSTGSAQSAGTGTRAHWKLQAIDAYADPTRALAWIDDAFDDSCHAWARERTGATLLVATEPHAGLTQREAARLRTWARTASLSA